MLYNLNGGRGSVVRGRFSLGTSIVVPFHECLSLKSFQNLHFNNIFFSPEDYAIPMRYSK